MLFISNHKIWTSLDILERLHLFKKNCPLTLLLLMTKINKQTYADKLFMVITLIGRHPDIDSVKDYTLQALLCPYWMKYLPAYDASYLSKLLLIRDILNPRFWLLRQPLEVTVMVVATVTKENACNECTVSNVLHTTLVLPIAWTTMTTSHCNIVKSYTSSDTSEELLRTSPDGQCDRDIKLRLD